MKDEVHVQIDNWVKTAIYWACSIYWAIGLELTILCQGRIGEFHTTETKQKISEIIIVVLSCFWYENCFLISTTILYFTNYEFEFIEIVVVSAAFNVFFLLQKLF